MEALEEVKEAIKDAHKRHPETHPSIEHSAWILKEEMAELKHELYKPERWRDTTAICEEACQVAASAIRLIAVRKSVRWKDIRSTNITVTQHKLR